jgi:hypothetical protein
MKFWEISIRASALSGEDNTFNLTAASAFLERTGSARMIERHTVKMKV